MTIRQLHKNFLEPYVQNWFLTVREHSTHGLIATIRYYIDEGNLHHIKNHLDREIETMSVYSDDNEVCFDILLERPPEKCHNL